MTAEELIHTMRLKAQAYAKAKADRVRLEHFRKSKRAMLMREAEKAGFKTAALQEREAMADKDYIALLDALSYATEQEELNRWDLEAAKSALDVWRSREATKRSERSAYGA